MIYLGTEEGLAAYNADDGSRIWVDDLYMPRIFHEYSVTTAAVYGVGDDAIVFFGRGDSFVYALLATSGLRIGRFKTDAEVNFVSLHPTEPILYVGGQDRQVRGVRFSTSGATLADTESCYIEVGSLQKVCDTAECKACRLGIFPGDDEEEAEYDWTFLSGGEVNSPPAQSKDGHLLYFGSYDRNLYALQSGHDTTTTTTTGTTTTGTTTTGTTTTTTTTTRTTTTDTETTTSKTTTSKTTTSKTTSTTTQTITTTTASSTTKTATTTTATTTTVSTTTTTTLVACPTGKFRTKANVCAQCRNRDACDDGKYQVGKCEEDVDGFECVPQSVCQPGEFLKGAAFRAAGECVTCPGKTFQTQSNHRDPNCVPWTECKDESQQYITPGTAQKDQVCSDHQICSPDKGFYESKAGTSTAARECKQLTDCNPGTYVAVASTPKSDRVCSACPTNTFSNSTNAGACVDHDVCAPGERVVTVGTPASDLDCGACDAGSFQAVESREASCKVQPTCSAGEKITPDSLTTKRVCSSCQLDEYQDAQGHQLEKCKAQPTCPAGTSISPDSLVSPRTCTPCSGGTYQDLDDHKEEVCTPQETCNPGLFISANSTTERRTCKACPENTFQPATEHQESSCIMQPTCGAGQATTPDSNTEKRTCFDCIDGTYNDNEVHRLDACTVQPRCPNGKWYANPDGAKALAVCKECPPRQFQPLENHRESECNPWTVCIIADNKQYVAKNGTDTTDTVCGSNVECSSTQWETQAPSETEPRLCVGLTTCMPGTYISVNRTGSADRNCSACDGATNWQDGANQYQCKVMSTCSPGQKVSGGAGAGSSKADLSCDDCPENYFQNASEHRLSTCFRQDYCGEGQVMSIDSNVTARSCSPCPNGTFMSAEAHRYDACVPYAVTACGVNERLVLAGSNTTDQACQPCEFGVQVQPAANHTLEYCVDSTTTTTTTATTSTTTFTYTIDCDAPPCVSLGKVRMDENRTTTEPPLESEVDDASKAMSSSSWIVWVVVALVLLVLVIIVVLVARKKQKTKGGGMPSESYANPMYDNEGKVLALDTQTMAASNPQLYDDIPTGGRSKPNTATVEGGGTGYLDIAVGGSGTRAGHTMAANATYGTKEGDSDSDIDLDGLYDTSMPLDLGADDQHYLDPKPLADATGANKVEYDRHRADSNLERDANGYVAGSQIPSDSAYADATPIEESLYDTATGNMAGESLYDQASGVAGNRNQPNPSYDTATAIMADESLYDQASGGGGIVGDGYISGASKGTLASGNQPNASMYDTLNRTMADESLYDEASGAAMADEALYDTAAPEASNSAIYDEAAASSVLPESTYDNAGTVLSLGTVSDSSDEDISI